MFTKSLFPRKSLKKTKTIISGFTLLSKHPCMPWGTLRGFRTMFTQQHGSISLSFSPYEYIYVHTYIYITPYFKFALGFIYIERERQKQRDFKGLTHMTVGLASSESVGQASSWRCRWKLLFSLEPEAGNSGRISVLQSGGKFLLLGGPQALLLMPLTDWIRPNSLTLWKVSFFTQSLLM